MIWDHLSWIILNLRDIVMNLLKRSSVWISVEALIVRVEIA